jgi:hypothetical protein
MSILVSYTVASVAIIFPPWETSKAIHSSLHFSCFLPTFFQVFLTRNDAGYNVSFSIHTALEWSNHNRIVLLLQELSNDATMPCNFRTHVAMWKWIICWMFLGVKTVYCLIAFLRGAPTSCYCFRVSLNSSSATIFSP